MTKEKIVKYLDRLEKYVALFCMALLGLGVFISPTVKALPATWENDTNYTLNDIDDIAGATGGGIAGGIAYQSEGIGTNMGIFLAVAISVALLLFVLGIPQKMVVVLKKTIEAVK